MPAYTVPGLLQCAADNTHCGVMSVPPQPLCHTCHGQEHSEAGRPLMIDMLGPDVGSRLPRFWPHVAAASRSARVGLRPKRAACALKATSATTKACRIVSSCK